MSTTSVFWMCKAWVLWPFQSTPWQSGHAVLIRASITWHELKSFYVIKCQWGRLLLLGGCSLCCYHLYFIQSCSALNWGRWSGFGPWWVLWYGSPCSLTKWCYCSWIGETKSTVVRQHQRHSEEIQLYTGFDLVLLFQIKLYVFSEYLTECKVQIYISWSEAGNLCISQI